MILIGKGDLLDDWVSKWQIPFTSFRTDVECHDSTVVFKLHSSVLILCFLSSERFFDQFRLNLKFTKNLSLPNSVDFPLSLILASCGLSMFLLSHFY